MEKTFPEWQLNIFNQPARIIIAGYTNSGKSHLCTKLVEKYEEVFSRIIICGVSSHPLQKNVNIKKKIEIHENIINFPNEKNPYKDPSAHTLLILDDNFLAAANSQCVVDSFTKGRHNNLSVIMITQNIFFPGKFARTISLNTSHYLLMKNRDHNQIETLARQIHGRERAKQVIDIYKNIVMRQPHGYLLLDLAVNTPEELQLRSNIVNETRFERVYLP